MKTPNIFEIATSELSQDAFVTWLIKWANPKYKDDNFEVYSCATTFVRKLLDKGADYEIHSIEAGRQWNNIDVWVQVNEEYFIVIEDKKGTSEHSNQLERYSKIAKEKFKNEQVEIKLVYFKMEEQGNFSNVIDAGYRLFTRKDMLEVLDIYSLDYPTDTICNFKKYLYNLDEQINSFRILAINDWNWYSWKGFYSEIQKHIGGNWGYVANARGGFLAFWWSWEYNELNGKKFEHYLQLEQDKLVCRLSVYEKENRYIIRDLYRSILFENVTKLNLNMQKYGRIGSTMGVAKFNGEYRITDNNNILDLDKTLSLLQSYEELIQLNKNDIEKLSLHTD